MTFNDPMELHYVDGKPVLKKKDVSKEIKKELEPEKDANPFDDLKRQLYNDLPQASIKRDRSMTARALNQSLESFNRRKNEANDKIAYRMSLDATEQLFFIDDWEFLWDRKRGTLKSTKKPDNGYNLEYKSPSILDDKKDALDKVYKLIKEHILRRKG